MVFTPWVAHNACFLLKKDKNISSLFALGSIQFQFWVVLPLKCLEKESWKPFFFNLQFKIFLFSDLPGVSTKEWCIRIRLSLSFFPKSHSFLFVFFALDILNIPLLKISAPSLRTSAGGPLSTQDYLEEGGYDGYFASTWFGPQVPRLSILSGWVCEGVSGRDEHLNWWTE